MQKNKGLYLLLAFISIILIMFFFLFFMHERTLENGILFKVSFEYDNAKNITYNFYNQNGKIGKVENWENYETSYLLEKTDYNSVKLLRRILKGRKEQKEPSKEEGITIYNGQNKRYYWIPFDSESAEELSKLIIDGYIHYEMKRTTEKTIPNEIYLYEKEDGLNWTKDGSTSRIIDTYQCETEDCKYLYVDKEHETILYDKLNYYYNYVSGTKEEIHTDAEIQKVKFVKWDNQIIGLDLQTTENKTAFYDLSKKECLTEFALQKIKVVNNDILLTIEETKEESQMTYKLQTMNRENKEILWTKIISDGENVDFEIERKEEFYILKRTENKNSTYKVLKEDGEDLIIKYLEEVELDEEHNIIGKTKEEENTVYEKYSNTGTLIDKSITKEE